MRIEKLNWLVLWLSVTPAFYDDLWSRNTKRNVPSFLLNLGFSISNFLFLLQSKTILFELFSETNFVKLSERRSQDESFEVATELFVNCVV
jgi:hypothetical protein